MQAILSYFRSQSVKLIFVILWAYFFYRIIMAGFKPNPYLLRVAYLGHPDSYPTQFIQFLLGSMVVQLILVILTHRFIASQWRSLILLLITLPYLFFLGLMSMHAPPPWSVMMVWQGLCLIFFTIGTLWQLGKFAYAKVTKTA